MVLKADKCLLSWLEKIKLLLEPTAFGKKDWQNEIVWEIGWFVLPEFQRRGIATIDSKCQTSTASCMPILPVKMSLPMQFATNWVFRYAEKLISNIPKAIG